jgi:hypothetical protein
MAPTLYDFFKIGILEGKYNVPELDCQAHLGMQDGHVLQNTLRKIGKPYCAIDSDGFSLQWKNNTHEWYPVPAYCDAIVILSGDIKVAFIPLFPPCSKGDFVTLNFPDDETDGLWAWIKQWFRNQ